MTAGASTEQPSSLERVSGAIVGGAAGSILASFVSFIPAIGALGWWSMVFGGVAGILYGALRPPRFSRSQIRLPEAVPGKPTPIGALGAATVRDLERPTAMAFVLGAILAIGSIPAGLWVYSALGMRPSLTVLGIVGVAGFVAALASAAFLPGLLLTARPRAALVAHVWLGAREFRRAFGSRDVAVGFPVTPAEVPAWIAGHPETDANREVLVELHLMSGDFVAARQAIDRLPSSTPRERFTVTMLGAMVAYQAAEPVDDEALTQAVEALPEGVDAVEAAVAVATLEARRALPDGDWREPMVRGRSLIPEGDLPILFRDFGAVNFRTILRKVWPVLALLVALTLILGLMVDGVIG
jgi:hypothetical protein